MKAIRMFCKKCEEDMIDNGSETVGTLETIVYECPSCRNKILLEVELEDEEWSDESW